MPNPSEEETITITGGGGIIQTVTREQLDKESEDWVKKRKKKPIKTRFRVTPTSKDVDKGAVSKLIQRVQRTDA